MTSHSDIAIPVPRREMTKRYFLVNGARDSKEIFEKLMTMHA